jgi:hypothetical protein
VRQHALLLPQQGRAPRPLRLLLLPEQSRCSQPFIPTDQAEEVVESLFVAKETAEALLEGLRGTVAELRSDEGRERSSGVRRDRLWVWAQALSGDETVSGPAGMMVFPGHGAFVGDSLRRSRRQRRRPTGWTRARWRDW